MKDVNNEGMRNWLHAAAQIDAQLQNSHVFEVEQRQCAAAAFQDWSAQQQALANQRQAVSAASGPRTINCQYIGNTAQCRSY
jgi:hypothetical protein